MNSLKKIGLWCVVVFFALATLVYFPSFASLCAVLIFALTLPVAKWKAFYNKYITGKWKKILVIALVILFFCTVPRTTDETLPDTTVEPTTEVTTEATTEATTEPANETTTESTTTPTVPATEVTEATIEAPTAPTTESATEPPATSATTPAETKPAHVHKFSPATCVSPKTCSCGATEGNPNGHAWREATCTTPKICSNCGETSGSNAGHHFSNGNCTTCGKEDPDYIRVTMVWIPTKGGKKYHSRSGCSGMEDPRQVTQAEAESLGYTPCQKCH